MNIGPLHGSIPRWKFQLFATEAPADQCQEIFPGGLDRNSRVAEARKGLYALLTKQLLAELHKLEERPWSAFGKAKKPLTDIDLGALLRGYEIHSKTVRGEDAYGNPERGRGYYLRDFKETFERYLRGFSTETGLSSRDTVTNPENVEENGNFNV